MIKLKRLTIALAALFIASATAWAQTEQTVAVTPVTGQTNQWTLTMPAGNVTLNVEYEPEFTATFKALTANTIEGGKATLKLDDADATLTDGKLNGIYEGQTITLTAQTGYKFRSVTAKKGEASNIVDPQVGQIIGSDGKNYAADATLPTGVTAVAKIAYVGSDNGEAEPYNHGLAIAISDANNGNDCTWTTSNAKVHTHNPTASMYFGSESGLQYNATQNSDTYPAFKAAIANNDTAVPTGCSAWFLASGYQWKIMLNAAGSAANLKTNATLASGSYWSSTEKTANNAWAYDTSDGGWINSAKGNAKHIRAVLAF